MENTGIVFKERKAVMNSQEKRALKSFIKTNIKVMGDSYSDEAVMNKFNGMGLSRKPITAEVVAAHRRKKLGFDLRCGFKRKKYTKHTVEATNHKAINTDSTMQALIERKDRLEEAIELNRKLQELMANL
jgi:hypothetical protein